MDKVKIFRECTRELERNLDIMNSTDCCQCSVTTSQCFIVVEIGRDPGISVKELASVLKLDKSAVSRAVEELVQKGFVIRESSKTDRRRVVLSLTEEGEARFTKIENDMYEKYKKVFSRIPKDKREQVIEALQILNVACEEEEEKCCDKSNGGK